MNPGRFTLILQPKHLTESKRFQGPRSVAFVATPWRVAASSLSWRRHYLARCCCLLPAVRRFRLTEAVFAAAAT
jgi:hypothetical protein